MTATQDATVLPWNSLSLTGSISGASFAGTTAITGSPGNATAFTGTGSGTFSGDFFSAHATELGLVWSVRDSNGSAAAGTFAGARPQ